MRLPPSFLLQVLAVSAHHLSFPQLFTPDIDRQTPLDPAMTLTQENVLISDVMGRDRSVNAFAGFTRSVEVVANRLDNSAVNSTVLAPLNSAIDKLPGKPWEDPNEYNALGATAYDGDEGRERAQRNIRKFVEAHVVPLSPWRENERSRSLLDGDREIWWEKKDGIMVLQPDGIEIQNVASKVGNGEVWIIKSVRKYT